MVPVVTSFHVKLVLVCALLFVACCFWYRTYDLYVTYRENILSQLHTLLDTALLPYKVARIVSREPLSSVPIPIVHITSTAIVDSWGEARSEGRFHEGTDIFAPRGTPVFSSTVGFVVRSGQNNLGGNSVVILGPGGVRYYYAHLDRIAHGIELGTYVHQDTVLGFVGNTGNASSTPPHLHFGVYKADGPQNPYPLLRER